VGLTPALAMPVAAKVLGCCLTTPQLCHCQGAALLPHNTAAGGWMAPTSERGLSGVGGGTGDSSSDTLARPSLAGLEACSGACCSSSG
jgi:hypothetical protein